MRKVLNENTHNGNCSSELEIIKLGYFLEVNDIFESLLIHMFCKYEWVFFTMFVLKYPAGSAGKYPDDKVLLSRFINSFMRHCKRLHYDPKYLWARERSSTGQYQYIFILLLNGNLVQNSHELIRVKASELWEECLGIEGNKDLVELWPTGKNDDSGECMLYMNYLDSWSFSLTCDRGVAYLAECYRKGESPRYVNDFGHSRVYGYQITGW